MPTGGQANAAYGVMLLWGHTRISWTEGSMELFCSMMIIASCCVCRRCTRRVDRAAFQLSTTATARSDSDRTNIPKTLNATNCCVGGQLLVDDEGAVVSQAAGRPWCWWRTVIEPGQTHPGCLLYLPTQSRPVSSSNY